MRVFVDHFDTVLFSLAGSFTFLEMRWRRWPRCRRAVVGVTVGLANGAILLGLTTIGVVVSLSAGSLAKKDHRPGPPLPAPVEATVGRSVE